MKPGTVAEEVLAAALAFETPSVGPAAVSQLTTLELALFVQSATNEGDEARKLEMAAPRRRAKGSVDRKCSAAVPSRWW